MAGGQERVHGHVWALGLSRQSGLSIPAACAKGTRAMAMHPIPHPSPGSPRSTPMSPARARRGRAAADQAVRQREPARHQPGKALAARGAAPMPIAVSRSRQHRAAHRAGRVARHRSGADRDGHRFGRAAHLAAQGYAGPGDEVLYVALRLLGLRYRRAALRARAGGRARCRLRHRCRCAAGLRDRSHPGGLRRQSEQPDRQLLPRPRSPGCMPACRPTCCWCSTRPMPNMSPADDDGALALAAAHANVLVTRTFSKIYGLAGERIGWGTGAPALIDMLNRIRGPFNVSNSGRRWRLRRWPTRTSSTAFAPPQCPGARALRRGARGAGQPRPAGGAERGELRAGAVRRRAERRSRLQRAGRGRLHHPLAAPRACRTALRITIGTAEQMDAIAAACCAIWRRPRDELSAGRDYRAWPAGRLDRAGGAGDTCRASAPPAMTPIPPPVPAQAERGLVGAGCDTAADAVRDADLVILCVPVGAMGDGRARARRSAARRALVSDVGSCKQSVAKALAEALPGHPSSRRTRWRAPNVRAGRGLCQPVPANRWCIITPPER
jgi:histidinol-phosphate aminotransferase